jgi:hypothetical protein
MTDGLPIVQKFLNKVENLLSNYFSEKGICKLVTSFLDESTIKKLTFRQLKKEDESNIIINGARDFKKENIHSRLFESICQRHDKSRWTVNDREKNNSVLALCVSTIETDHFSATFTTDTHYRFDANIDEDQDRDEKYQRSYFLSEFSFNNLVSNDSDDRKEGKKKGKLVISWNGIQSRSEEYFIDDILYYKVERIIGAHDPKHEPIVELFVRNLDTGKLKIRYDDMNDEIIRIYGDNGEEEKVIETIDISDSSLCMSKRPEIWNRLTKYFPSPFFADTFDKSVREDEIYSSLISLIQSLAHLSTET